MVAQIICLAATVLWCQAAKLLFHLIEIQTHAINILQTVKTFLRQAH